MSLIKTLVPAANLQEILRAEEYIEFHHEYTVRKNISRKSNLQKDLQLNYAKFFRDKKK